MAGAGRWATARQHSAEQRRLAESLVACGSQHWRSFLPAFGPAVGRSSNQRQAPVEYGDSYRIVSAVAPSHSAAILVFRTDTPDTNIPYTRLVIQSGFYVDPLCLTMKPRLLLRMDMYVFIVLHILRSWDSHVTHVPVIQLPSDSAASSRCPFWLGDMTKVLRRRLDMCMKP